MTVAEYRNEIDHLSQIACDRHACVGVDEKIGWYYRALKARDNGHAIIDACKRLKVEDKQQMLSALARLSEGISRVESTGVV